MIVFGLERGATFADTVTIKQKIVFDGGPSGFLQFSFPALCEGHNGVPKSYKTGSLYPYDALLSGEVTVICGECGHVSIVQIERP